ncbi:MAG: HPr kinase/phosphorylase [Alphaproteobacteria bacterium]
MSPDTIHASCVAFGEIGLLLRGASGAGKSDLALRLIDCGAMLVADDRVALTEKAGRVLAMPPPALAGRLEVRGVGIFSLPHLDGVPVRLICDLENPAAIERLPEPGWCAYLGVRIRRMDVAPFEASAAIRLRIAAYAAAGEPDSATGAKMDEL